MKNTIRLILILGAIALTAMAFQNCSDVKFGAVSDSGNGKTGGGLEVEEPELPPEDTDTPAPEDPNNNTLFACGIDNVKDIRVNLLSVNLGQEEVESAIGVKSLIELSKGVTITTDKTIRTNQLRLVLDDINNQVIDTADKAYAIKTPSGQQSGLKVNMSGAVTFKANTTYKISFELDPSTQLHEAGKKCILKPVLSAKDITEVAL